MGAKHGKYAYLKVSEDLYAKIRVFKKKDPSSSNAYLFAGVFVKKPPRKAKVLSESDLPEESIKEIKSKLSRFAT
ncbi:MAG: DUF5622 domain-containing protein [Sulfolobales archaeon]